MPSCCDICMWDTHAGPQRSQVHALTIFVSGIPTHGVVRYSRHLDALPHGFCRAPFVPNVFCSTAGRRRIHWVLRLVCIYLFFPTMGDAAALQFVLQSWF